MGDKKEFRGNVSDAVTFPILTREISGDFAGSSSSGASPVGGSNNEIAQNTLRAVLGWRYRSQDPKGFVAALTKAVDLQYLDGRAMTKWRPRTYTLQADLGEITGVQAGILQQARVILEQSLPLLDGLEPLRPDVDHEDAEAQRFIVRNELHELVTEFAQHRGPRVQRVDLMFKLLLDEDVNDVSPGMQRFGGQEQFTTFAEEVDGQLGELRRRFGLTRNRVNTLEEEQNFTSFLVFVDYVVGLFVSWVTKRKYFTRTREGGDQPFLGTQLVLISEALEVIVEQVHEVFAGMDSVFFGPAERQATELDFAELSTEDELTDVSTLEPLTVAELLDWILTFVQGEGPALLQESGKDGAGVVFSTLTELADLARGAAELSADPERPLVRAFHTERVTALLEGLATQLETAAKLADGAKRERHRQQGGIVVSSRRVRQRALSDLRRAVVLSRAVDLTRNDVKDAESTMTDELKSTLAAHWAEALGSNPAFQPRKHDLQDKVSPATRLSYAVRVPVGQDVRAAALIPAGEVTTQPVTWLTAEIADKTTTHFEVAFDLKAAKPGAYDLVLALDSTRSKPSRVVYLKHAVQIES